jgi:hypothetical protein
MAFRVGFAIARLIAGHVSPWHFQKQPELVKDFGDAYGQWSLP